MPTICIFKVAGDILEHKTFDLYLDPKTNYRKIKEAIYHKTRSFLIFYEEISIEIYYKGGFTPNYPLYSLNLDVNIPNLEYQMELAKNFLKESLGYKK